MQEKYKKSHINLTLSVYVMHNIVHMSSRSGNDGYSFLQYGCQTT